MPSERNSFKDVSTLSETIQNGTGKSITLYNTSILSKVENVEYSISNIIYDYADELNAAKELYTLSDSELSRYSMRPDLLSYDIYNNLEYEFIILFLNDIIDPREFTKSDVYLIDIDTLNSILESIVAKEEDFVNYNRNNL